MSNSTFATAVAGVQPPDPRKHVNYTQGMVLGVDDFTQEFAYLSNRGEWLAREAIGYGTISGLQVALGDADDGDKQLSVGGGVALSPRGELIRVGAPQCARLGAWLRLASTRQKLEELNLTAAGSIRASLVLGYRACAANDLPIPGEPCRCDSETMAPSRIMDDFWLELSLTPPPQSEEAAVRSFVAWLRAIELTDADPAGGLDAFIAAIRTAAEGAGSPPELLHGSPPAGLQIPRQHLREWMRTAFRLWVTELRPKWQAEFAGPAATASGCDDCDCHGTGADLPEDGREGVLLAEVILTRTGSVLTHASLDESNRPFLVHLRMLQEMMLGGPGDTGTEHTFATLIVQGDHTLRCWIHHPTALTVPIAALELLLDGTAQPGVTLVPVQPNLFDLVLPGAATTTFHAGARIELHCAADQMQEPSGRKLSDAIEEDDCSYANYAEPRLTVYGQSELDTMAALVGDIVGPPGANQIAKIQNASLNLTGLTAGKVLGYDGIAWRPVPLPPPIVSLGGDVTGPPALTKLSAIQGASLDLAALANGAILQYNQPTNKWRAVAPALGGDATGPVGNCTVAKIRGHAVDPQQPADADLLTWTGGTNGTWTPKKIAVEHPDGLDRYMIVAAVWITFDDRGVAKVKAGSAYNGVKLASGAGTSNSGWRFSLTYGVPGGTDVAKGYVSPPSSAQYIIKGTVFGANPGALGVADMPRGEKFFDLLVQAVTTKPPLAVMIEISAYGKNI